MVRCYDKGDECFICKWYLELGNLNAGKKAIGYKWVFAIKINPDGYVARLKAHLVAKGYA